MALYNGMNGTLEDCFLNRTELIAGDYAAICDKTTMKMAMDWDFRLYFQVSSYHFSQFSTTNFQSPDKLLKNEI